MKKFKLEQIRPSKKLEGLIEKIPELRIDEGFVKTTNKELYIYNIIENNISFTPNMEGHKIYYQNPLLNKEVLSGAISSDISHISQEQFCMVLEEHLYLKGKQKMEELLPQIQEWHPNAILTIDDEEFMRITCKNIGTIIQWNSSSYAKCFEFNHNEKIQCWEDRENLIVKKNNME